MSTAAWLTIFAYAILGPLHYGYAQTTRASEPAQVVDALHDALIAAATGPEPLSYEKRFEQLQPVINSTHDFTLIARLVGGHFWKDINDGERTKFIEAFRSASIATYASRFVSADGVRFERARSQDSLGNRVTVSSHLIRPDGSRVTFDYILHEVQHQWRIITIMVDGVSDLALQRAEITNFYADAGLDGVLQHLEAKADRR